MSGASKDQHTDVHHSPTHSRQENSGPTERNAAAFAWAPMARAALGAAAAALLGTLVFIHSPAFAQEEGPAETKLPSKLGKLKGGDDNQLAFSGKVQSVDVKLKLLNMAPEEGKGSEIFPLKKNTVIRTAHGDRISLEDLKAGCDVVIYYELKGAQRVVKRVIELSPRKGKGEKAPPSPS